MPDNTHGGAEPPQDGDSQQGSGQQPPVFAGANSFAGRSFSERPTAPVPRRDSAEVFDSEDPEQADLPVHNPDPGRSTMNIALSRVRLALQGTKRRMGIWAVLCLGAGTAFGYHALPWFLGEEKPVQKDAGKSIKESIDAAVLREKLKQEGFRDKAVKEAVEKALEDHVSGWENAVRSNPGEMRIWGYDGNMQEMWFAEGLSKADYAGILARSHAAKAPAEILGFIKYETGIDQRIQDVTSFVVKGAKTPEEKAQRVFDYIRFQMQRTEEKASGDAKASPRFVKYPIETVADRGGSRYDLAVLAAAMLKSLGSEAMIFYYPPDGEKEEYIAVGVEGSFQSYRPDMGIKKQCVGIGGKNYFFFDISNEPQGDHAFVIGEMPEHLSGRKLHAYRVPSSIVPDVKTDM